MCRARPYRPIGLVDNKGIFLKGQAINSQAWREKEREREAGDHHTTIF